MSVTLAPVSARTPVSPPPPPIMFRLVPVVTIWLPAPVAQSPVLPPPPAPKLMVVPLFKVIMPPPVALPPTLPPAPLRFTERPVAMMWLGCPLAPTPLASSAMSPPPNGGLMADPLSKMI
jgi:hypothetical protein